MLPFGIGVGEMAVIAIVAVMLFGSRLPEVARQLGSSYQQFRKGLSEIQSSIKADLDANDTSTSTKSSSTKKKPEFQDYNDDYDAPPAPKFVPPSEDEAQMNSV